MAKSFAQAAALEGLREYAKQWDARGRNMLPIWEQVIDEFHRGEAQVLMAEGRASGWHPKYERLKDNYRRWKQQVAPGRPILNLTGRLRTALTANPAPGTWYIKDRTMLVIRPSLRLDNHPGDLIAVHQMGRPGGPGSPPMVAREPVRLVRSEVRNIGKIVARYVAFGIAGRRARA